MIYEGPYEIDLCKIWDCITSEHNEENSFGKMIKEIHDRLENVEEEINNEQQGGKIIIL